jgi:hypothetical protein
LKASSAPIKLSLSTFANFRSPHSPNAELCALLSRVRPTMWREVSFSHEFVLFLMLSKFLSAPAKSPSIESVRTCDICGEVARQRGAEALRRLEVRRCGCTAADDQIAANFNQDLRIFLGQARSGVHGIPKCFEAVGGAVAAAAFTLSVVIRARRTFVLSLSAAALNPGSLSCQLSISKGPRSETWSFIIGRSRVCVGFKLPINLPASISNNSGFSRLSFDGLRKGTLLHLS